MGLIILIGTHLRSILLSQLTDDDLPFVFPCGCKLYNKYDDYTLCNFILFLIISG